MASRDKKIIKRWSLSGDPRGVAVGADGTIYVGLAETQSIIAVDPSSGAIRNRIVLDSADIAATKELVTLRTNPARTRLYVANGSDESALILSLPDLAILREITMEGETVRDVVPDPKGRYVYVLGRRVHVFDPYGKTRLRTLTVDDPMAIAANATGTRLAVLATEDYGSGKATAVTLFDTATWKQLSRTPLQTDKRIEAAMFAAGDRSLLAFSRNALIEMFLASRPPGIHSNPVCLPTGSGAQVATSASTDATLLVYAERRCSVSTAFPATERGATPASLYGISAYAVAHDPKTNSIVATDPAGFLTIYNVPRPALAR